MVGRLIDCLFAYSCIPLLYSFAIGTTAANHTVEFTKAARTEQAHAYTLRASRCLAKTAASIYLNEDLYNQAVADFKKGKPQ